LREGEVDFGGLKRAEDFEFGGSESVEASEEDVFPRRGGGAKLLGREFEALRAEKIAGLAEACFEAEE
jgi:hypothetical protein